jgi:hypothetical protein
MHGCERIDPSVAIGIGSDRTVRYGPGVGCLEESTVLAVIDGQMTPKALAEVEDHLAGSEGEAWVRSTPPSTRNEIGKSRSS